MRTGGSSAAFDCSPSMAPTSRASTRPGGARTFRGPTSVAHGAGARRWPRSWTHRRSESAGFHDPAPRRERLGARLVAPRAPRLTDYRDGDSIRVGSMDASREERKWRS